MLEEISSDVARGLGLDAWDKPPRAPEFCLYRPKSDPSLESLAVRRARAAEGLEMISRSVHLRRVHSIAYKVVVKEIPTTCL